MGNAPVEITEQSLATSAEHSESEAEFRRIAPLICAGIFVSVIATDKQLAQIPLRSYLKNHLHLEPSAMAAFFFVVGYAWYLKPLAGILSDCVPIFGTRRRSYLLLCSGLGALGWLCIAGMPLTYRTLLVGMVFVNAMAMVCSTVAGGLIVDVGKRRGATGRLSSMRMVAQNAASLVGKPVGGMMAGIFRLMPVTAAALLATLFAAGAGLLREEPRRPDAQEVLVNTGRQLRAILTSWPLLATVGLTFLHYVAPGFDSLLYYHQQNALKMTDAQIGMVGLVGSLTAILGAYTYGRICRRFTIRTLLYLGMTLNTISILFYYAYWSLGAAFAVEAAAGFVGMLGLLPLYDLSARATPRGCEALGYSLIMAIGNFAIGLSDVWGTWLAKSQQLRFTDMVWINAGTTALILVFIPLLPGALVNKREGGH